MSKNKTVKLTWSAKGNNHDTFLETRIALIEYAYFRVLEKVELYLKKFSIEFTHLPDFVKNPQGYLGQSTGIKKIIERCIDQTLSTLLNELRDLNISINFVFKSILKKIYGGKKF
ncbi:MAG: hypothetical protein U9Q73_01875 [Nanoarchaeota archaeon]|nr:hypothetical protein [Nanoarchaeota archaeon]